MGEYKTKVGVHSSEQIETADLHDGKCLVYKYRFKLQAA